jgi:probable HAF family extracellular repeat protein
VSETGDRVTYHGFLWRDGTMVDLGTLAPETPDEFRSSYAVDISDGGDIVGSDVVGDVVSRAVIWKRGGAIERLPTARGWTSDAWGIGNGGVIIGGEQTLGRAGRNRPVIWVHERRFRLNRLLPPDGPRMEGLDAVNDRGWILGSRVNRPGAGTYLLTPTTCDGRVPTVVGTHGDDVVNGTPGPDVVVAGAGDDHITTGGGNDLVCAGGGDDRIRSGAGGDEVRGERGADIVHAGRGADTAHGGRGRDRLYGDRDSDALDGGNGDDLCVGGSDEDAAAHCERTATVP